MKRVKEKRPEFGGRFFMLTPPMSREVQLNSGLGLDGWAIGATVEEGWLAFPFSRVGESENSSGGGFGFGFVIGMADFATVREAIALARAL